MVTKRPRGILTHDDREYILLDREYPNPQQHSEKRQNIRDRFTDAIKDFTVLRHLSDDQRQMVFEELSEDYALYTGVVDAISVLSNGVRDANLEMESILESGLAKSVRTVSAAIDDNTLTIPDLLGTDVSEVDTDVGSDSPGPDMVRDLEEGNRWIRVLDEVDVDISFEYTDVPQLPILYSEFLDGEELTDRELGVLVRSGILEDTGNWDELKERFGE